MNTPSIPVDRRECRRAPPAPHGSRSSRSPEPIRWPRRDRRACRGPLSGSAARGPQDRSPSGGNLANAANRSASTRLLTIGAMTPAAPASRSRLARGEIADRRPYDRRPAGERNRKNCPRGAGEVERAVLHVEDDRVERPPAPALPPPPLRSCRPRPRTPAPPPTGSSTAFQPPPQSCAPSPAIARHIITASSFEIHPLSAHFGVAGNPRARPRASVLRSSSPGSDPRKTRPLPSAASFFFPATKGFLRPGNGPVINFPCYGFLFAPQRPGSAPAGNVREKRS